MPPGGAMAIDGPRVADDAWKMFAHGQRVGSFGEFDSQETVSTIYWAMPRMLPLPATAGASTGVPTVTLAFRAWLAIYDHGDRRVPTGIANPDLVLNRMPEGYSGP